MKNKIALDYVEPDLKAATLQEAEADHLVDVSLGISSYENAVIYPGIADLGGGVVDRDGKFVRLTSIYNGVNQEGAYDAKIEDEDCEVVYLGMFYSCWGHCITDCLKHLWILNSPQRRSLEQYKFVYTTTNWGSEIGANFRTMLSLLGLDVDSAERVQVPKRYKRVLVPDPCIYYDLSESRMFYTTEYQAMVQILIDRAMEKFRSEEQNCARKVYFTRSGVKDFRNDVANDRVLDSVFQSCGYEIVRPETLSFVEMVRLLSQTEEFASPDGSCAHNALFLPLGSKSVVVRRAKYINKTQSMIDQLRGLESIPIDANYSCLLYDRSLPMCGPFFVYINKRLAAFSGMRRECPVGRFAQYVCMSIYRQFRHMCGVLLRGMGVLRRRKLEAE